MSGEFPADLQRFLAEHVHTPQQLEALLFMSKAGRRLVSPEALARALGVSVTAATIALTRLSSHQLLIPRIGSLPLFEYGPGSELLAAAASRLLAQYQTDRQQVLSAIEANAASRSRSLKAAD